MRFRFVILFLFLCAYGKSQTMHKIDNLRYKHLSDSIISIKLDSSIFESIDYFGTWETFGHKCIDFETILDSKPIKYVNVHYHFISLCGQKYGYQTKGFRTSGGFEYTFDFDYNLICEPDYELIKAASEAHEKCYISYVEAQKIAIENTQKKSRKTWANYLINDLDNNQVFWWIERETGFRNGIIEQIKINAINGEIIEKNEIKYYKNFFKALSDKLFKVP